MFDVVVRSETVSDTELIYDIGYVPPRPILLSPGAFLRKKWRPNSCAPVPGPDGRSRLPPDLPVTFATPSTRLISLPMYRGIRYLLWTVARRSCPVWWHASARERLPVRQLTFSALCVSGFAFFRAARPPVDSSPLTRGLRSAQLCLETSPRLVRHAPEDDARLLDCAAVEFQGGGDCDKRKRVRPAVANLQVIGVLREIRPWQLYGNDELAVLKVRVLLRCVSGQAVNSVTGIVRSRPSAPLILTIPALGKALS